MSLKPPIAPTSSAGTSSITERLDDLEDGNAVTVRGPAATGVAATDTAALQALISAASSAGSTKIELRRGDYAITNLTLPVLGAGSLSIVGQGPDKTTLTCSASSGYAVTFGDGGATDTRRLSLQDLYLAGNANADGAVKYNHTRFCDLKNLHIEAFTKAGAVGVYFVEALANYFATIDAVQFKNIPYGIKFGATAGIGGNSNWVRGCHFNNHSSNAIYFNGGDSNRIVSNEFNGSITTAILMDNDSDENIIAFNKWDGPTTAVNISTANCNKNALIGNIGAATVTDSGTETFRVEANGVTIPETVAVSLLDIGGYNLTAPTNGIGVGGDIRSNGAIGADFGESGEVLIGARGPASEAGVQFNRANVGTTGAKLYLAASTKIASDGDLAVITAGKGLQVKEGSNAKMGSSTLVGGTVTVSTTAVTASSRIQLTSNVDGGTPGFLRVSARTAGTSFTITSSSGTDTSTVSWLILEPA